MLDVGKLAVVLSADIGPGKCRRKADMTPTQADMMPTECRRNADMSAWCRNGAPARGSGAPIFLD
jgi:hypothetical protein